MRLRHFVFLLVFSVLAMVGVAGPTAAQPYVGEWSNGRGDPLILTATTIKFANNQPVPYRDITKASDGNSFTLMLNAKGRLNYLSPFMRMTMKGKGEMSTEGADSFNGDATSSATWFRDK